MITQLKQNSLNIIGGEYWDVVDCNNICMSKLFAEGTQAMAGGRNTDFLEITTFETGAFREREPNR